MKCIYIDPPYNTRSAFEHYNDGRILVLDYKGEHLAANQDTAEKANIGARLAEVAGSSVIFWMAEGADKHDFINRLNAVIEVA